MINIEKSGIIMANNLSASEGDTRTKFNVNKDVSRRIHNDIIFDSEMEMKYFRDVVIPSFESGIIIYFELQKPYELLPKFTHMGITVQPIKYVADFFIRYKDGREEVIDIKGCPDSVALIKRKLFWYNYPTITYRWVCHSAIDGGWCDYDYVKKQRSIRKKQKKLKKLEEENG